MATAVSFVDETIIKPLITCSAIYTAVDTLWMYANKNENFKVPKHEMILHHLCVLGIILNHKDEFFVRNSMVVEFSTLSIMATTMIHTNFLKDLSKKLWIYLRFVYFPMVLLWSKLWNTEGSVVYILCCVLLCLSAKWSTKICDRNNYSAFFIMLTLIDSERLTPLQFIAINLLTIVSFIHHSISSKEAFVRGTRLTRALDEMSICFITFTRLVVGFELHLAITVAAFVVKYYYQTSIVNHLVYVYSGMYTIPRLFDVKFALILAGTAYSYRVLKHQDNSYPWHLCNGLWLYNIHKNFPVNVDVWGN